MSFGVHAKIITVENRLNEKFKLEMLVSTDRNTRAMEAMQLMLMKYLQQGKLEVEGPLTTTDLVREVEVNIYVTYMHC